MADCFADSPILVFFFCELDAKLRKLNVVYHIGSIGHKLRCILNLREGNDITDGVTAVEEHEHSVEAICHTAVRWCAIFESFDEEAKAECHLLFGKTYYLKHFFLKVGVVDSHTAATEFNTI